MEELHHSRSSSVFLRCRFTDGFMGIVGMCILARSEDEDVAAKGSAPQHAAKRVLFELQSLERFEHQRA